MLDSPTNYGSGDLVRGNYATLNPLDTSSNITLSDGNLKTAAPSGNDWRNSRATFAISSGKWYWETTLLSGIELLVGLLKSEASLDLYIGIDTNGWGYSANGGWIWHNGTNSTYGASIGTNDVAGIAFDADNGTLVFYKNGVSQGTAFTGLTSGPYFPAVSHYNSSSGLTNFGQQPFKYPLAGYKSLCSTNLPTPAIADGSTAMDVKLYTGNSSTQTISGLNFSPDLVWTKSRANAYSHDWWDTVRGVNKLLSSNNTNAESTTTDGLDSFNSDGFSLGPNEDSNYGIAAAVAWTWDAGSSTVSNTDGSITSSVRANVSAGFSIVTASPSGTADTYGHGLGVTPSLIISKRRDGSGAWYVRTSFLANPGSHYLILNTTDAVATDTSAWANTAANSSVITVNASYLYGGSADLISYCFAPVEGFSSFGSYTGNGSTDGPFVYTGFRPRWVMIKESSASGNNWNIWDAERDTYNVTSKQLKASAAGAEVTNVFADFVSNGFKIPVSTGGINGASRTYIYAAFAEHPFKTSRAR
jgi:hypothetical protein